ncbi:hypothetical protein GGX14DRAFT_403407 [Mycena pura]|uniref:Uncharacterized protein n=1 Tax=Mycena pura TaxID=153505 RepID=A0AAD6Y140_9AGAR|nr:hypothetical protein GGX14DRAFT_403407 [Mycena pura]
MTTYPNPNTVKALTLQSTHMDCSYLSSFYNSKTFEEFAEVLSRAPQLAPHVRSLSLQFLPGHSSSLEAAAALTAILAKLTNTNTLTVQMEAAGHECPWSSFSPGIQAALQTTLLSPALTSLHLLCLRFDGPVEFVSILTQASQLRELVISQVFLINTGDGDITLPSMRRSLHTLKVDCDSTTPQLLRLLTRIIDSSRLRHLLTFIFPELESAACELLASAVNVVHYHVRLEEYSKRLAINLRPLRHLRTLEITLDLHVATFTGDPVWCAKRIIKSAGADAARLDEGGDQEVEDEDDDAEDYDGENEGKDMDEPGSGDPRNSVVTDIIFNVNLNDIDQWYGKLVSRTMGHLADMLDEMIGLALYTVTFRIACKDENWGIVNEHLLLFSRKAHFPMVDELALLSTGVGWRREKRQCSGPVVVGRVRGFGVRPARAADDPAEPTIGYVYQYRRYRMRHSRRFIRGREQHEDARVAVSRPFHGSWGWSLSAQISSPAGHAYMSAGHRAHAMLHTIQAEPVTPVAPGLSTFNYFGGQSFLYLSKKRNKLGRRLE